MEQGRLSTALGGAALALFLSGSAFGASTGTCELRVGVDYLSAAEVASRGDHVRVQVTIGTGAIQNGTLATLRALRFFLQCNGAADRLLPCVQDGTAVAYAGDETITTTCPGVGWATGHAASPRPNQVVFTPSTPLDIPANAPAFCELEFDVIVLGPSHDRTPGVVEQLAAVGFGDDDASCDDGLRAVVGTMTGLRVH